MPPYRLWWLVLPLYAGYAVPAALLTLMFRPFGFLKVPLMRTAYFLDGIVAWFERTFDRLKSLLVRRGNAMNPWELRCRLEHIQCGIDCILERLEGDAVDQEKINAQAARLKASNEALAAAVSASSLPSNAAPGA